MNTFMIFGRDDEHIHCVDRSMLKFEVKVIWCMCTTIYRKIFAPCTFRTLHLQTVCPVLITPRESYV